MCRACIYMYDCVFLGELATKQPLIAGMRTVKKETLKLITCWVSKSQDPAMVNSDFRLAMALHMYTLDGTTCSYCM